MSRWAVVVLCLVAALPACGGAAADKPAASTGPDTDTLPDTAPPDDTAEPGTCARFGFPEPESWALPPVAGAGPWRASASLQCGADDEVLYMLQDLDGDGLADFVLVRDCASLDGTGDDHWVVYRGTGSGWSDTAESWSLPLPQRPYGWANNRADSCEAAPQSRFALKDVTGDERPDLVLFDDCDDSTAVGSGSWRVHVGGEGGFDTEGVEWVVSEAPLAAAFTLPEKRECGDDQTPRYTLSDVDGDDVPDLLLTGDCGAHPGLGRAHWIVIPGTGAGFDAGATQTLELPDLGEGVELPISGALGCQSPTDLVFGFGDTDQDDDRDLIISGYCDGRSEPGTTRWDVYRYEDGALSPEPVPLELPDLGVDRGWVRAGGVRCSAENPIAQAFWDVDGDERWDVLVRESCVDSAQPGLGTDHYRLWLRNDDMSLSEELRFELPTDPEGTLYLDLQDDFCGHPGDRLVETGRLNGDAVPDLITTHGCAADAAIGWTEWGVALGGCLERSR